VLPAPVQRHRITFGARSGDPLRILQQLAVLLRDEHVIDAVLVQQRIGILLGFGGRTQVDDGPHAMSEQRIAPAIIEAAELVRPNERAALDAPTIDCRQAAEVSNVEA